MGRHVLCVWTSHLYPLYTISIAIHACPQRPEQTALLVCWCCWGWVITKTHDHNAYGQASLCTGVYNLHFFPKGRLYMPTHAHDEQEAQVCMFFCQFSPPHLSFYGYRVIREINDIHTPLAIIMLHNIWHYLHQLLKLAIHGAFMIHAFYFRKWEGFSTSLSLTLVRDTKTWRTIVSQLAGYLRMSNSPPTTTVYFEEDNRKLVMSSGNDQG